MIDVVAIHMEGSEHLEHIARLRWVQTNSPGSPASSTPEDATRAEMYQFVKENPRVAFALNHSRTQYAYLEAVNGHVRYVRTAPDSTKSDNLLSLPRF